MKRLVKTPSFVAIASGEVRITAKTLCRIPAIKGLMICLDCCILL